MFKGSIRYLRGQAVEIGGGWFLQNCFAGVKLANQSKQNSEGDGDGEEKVNSELEDVVIDKLGKSEESDPESKSSDIENELFQVSRSGR